MSNDNGIFGRSKWMFTAVFKVINARDYSFHTQITRNQFRWSNLILIVQVQSMSP